MKTLGSVLPVAARSEGRGIFYLHSNAYTPIGVFLGVFADLSSLYGIDQSVLELILESEPKKYGIIATGNDPKSYKYSRVLLSDLNQKVNYQPVPKSDKFKMFCLATDSLFYSRYGSSEFDSNLRRVKTLGENLIGQYGGMNKVQIRNVRSAKRRFHSTLDQFCGWYGNIVFSDSYYRDLVSV